MTAVRMRPIAAQGQGSQPDLVTPSQIDRTRDAIIERCPAIESLSRGAVLELDAEATAALHDSINSRSIETAGIRPPKHRREQLRGEDPLTGEDFAQLAVQAPEDFCAWLRLILAAVARRAPRALIAVLADVAPVAGFHLSPGSRPSMDAIDAAAGLAGLAGPTAEAVIRDARDGAIDDRAGHLERIRALKEQVAQLEAAVGGSDAR